MMRLAPALDGGICRIRLPGGLLSAEQARRIAEASHMFGNGIIELTNRANLQLRGVGTPDAIGGGLRNAPEALLVWLIDAGLGPTSLESLTATPAEADASTDASTDFAAVDQATQRVNRDAVRNILISPSAGFDASMQVDTRPLLDTALALLTARMAQAPTPHRNVFVENRSSLDAAPKVTTAENAPFVDTKAAEPTLSPKFSIQIDGGEALTVFGHHHDIWFSAVDLREHAALAPAPSDARETPAGDHWFAFGLASSLPTNREKDGDTARHTASDPTSASASASGMLRAADVPAAIDALVAHFLRLRADGTARDAEGRTAGRLRDILAPSDHIAPHAFADSALSAIGLTVWRPKALAQWRRRLPSPESARCIGLFDQGRNGDTPSSPGSSQAPDRQALGVQSVLGRVTPSQLARLAALSEHFGDGTLRVTPWQGVIVPNLQAVTKAAAEHALAAAREAGWVVDADAPITRLHACSGNTGCAKAGADTKADALKMAARLAALAPAQRQGVSVHVSGCARRCASAVTRDFTLIAQSPGRYDMLGRDASGQHNALLCSDIDIDAAADRILKETASP